MSICARILLNLWPAFEISGWNAGEEFWIHTENVTARGGLYSCHEVRLVTPPQKTNFVVHDATFIAGLSDMFSLYFLQVFIYFVHLFNWDSAH